MKIEFSKKFEKDLKKLSPKIRLHFASRLELFAINKNHILLNNHKLLGKLAGCKSINIFGDLRAIFEEFDAGNTIYFLSIGTHSQLYG